jgi:hypothetical protein
MSRVLVFEPGTKEATMNVLYDDLWFCTDCLMAAVNDDFTGLDYYYGADADARERKIRAGLGFWGAHLVPDFDSETGEGILEFSKVTCDCCDSPLAGTRHRFAVLKPNE